MAAMASSAFYRGRDEPLGVQAQHVPHNLEQYLSALERRVQAEKARAQRAPTAAPCGEDARVHELLAGVRYAQRMASDLHAAAPLLARIDAVRQDAEALLRTQPSSCTGCATRSEADAYWDDYLYAGLVPPATARASPPATLERRVAAPPAAAASASRSEPDGSMLRQRRPPSDEAPPSRAAESTRPTTLTNDRTLQEALSSELLRMAGVLKQNSAALAEALERDRQLVEQAGTGLEQNLDLMTRTRGQLGAFTRKARRMGWFTLGSIVSVVVCWVVLFIVIRLT